jgi:hypothetical protein
MCVYTHTHTFLHHIGTLVGQKIILAKKWTPHAISSTLASFVSPDVGFKSLMAALRTKVETWEISRNVSTNTRDYKNGESCPCPRNILRIEVQLHLFLTSTLGGSEWSITRLGRVTPAKKAGAHWIEGWGPWTSWRREISLIPAGFLTLERRAHSLVTMLISISWLLDKINWGGGVGLYQCDVGMVEGSQGRALFYWNSITTNPVIQ